MTLKQLSLAAFLLLITAFQRLLRTIAKPIERRFALTSIASSRPLSKRTRPNCERHTRRTGLATSKARKP